MDFRDGLKVLYISPLPPPYGGIATWTKTVLEWARKNNQYVEVVNTTKSKNESASPGSSIGFFAQMVRTINIIKDLLSKLIKTDFDIVHLNSGPSLFGLCRDYVCINIIRLFKIKTVIQFHYDVENFKKKSPIYTKLIKVVVSKVDSAWVLNEKSFNVIYDTNPYINIRITPNFINKDIITEKKIHNSKMKDVGYLGAVKKSKGISEVLKIADAFPKLKFHLIGAIEDKKLLQNASENVYFYGPLDHTKALSKLREMDIFLFLSYTEGSSLAILEAMSQGLPIITTDVGANLSVLENTGNFIVDRDNLNDIYNKISLLEDPNIRKVIGNQNLDIIKLYSSDIVISRLFREYNVMLKIEK